MSNSPPKINKDSLRVSLSEKRRLLLSISPKLKTYCDQLEKEILELEIRLQI